MQVFLGPEKDCDSHSRSQRKQLKILRVEQNYQSCDLKIKEHILPLMSRTEQKGTKRMGGCL